MPWIQIVIDSDATRAPRVSDALSDLGAVSVTFRDIHDDPVYEPALGTEPLWRGTSVTGLFEAGADVAPVIAQLRALFGADLVARVEPLADQPWERAWLDHFHPMCFGKRLWICPTGTPPPEPTAVNLMMDPGLAFGTGTHATTALCLEWIDGHDFTGQTVIDYGCGSGVLAVAAALLGAREVHAVDLDPQALLATRENAQRNHVADRISVYSPEQFSAQPADVLLANILANPLRELAPLFERCVRPGGTIVLSGILDDQASDVARAYEPGFNLNATTRRDGWARIDGTRKRVE